MAKIFTKFRKVAGFTLIELIVVIGIFSMVSMMALPIAIKNIQTTKSDSAMKDLKSAIFLVEQDAFSKKVNQGHGIKFYSHSYVVYTGNSLATATITDTFTQPDDVLFTNINFGGGSEISFPVGSFRPLSSGSIDVTNGASTYRIQVSSEGTIQSSKLWKTV